MQNLDKVFTKDYLSKVSRALGEYTHSLLYWDDEPTKEQKKSGWELVKLHYILAAIGDHIFDYFPYSYVLNDEQSEEYPSFFLDLQEYDFYSLVANIEEDLDHHFSVLDTVSTEDLIVERDSWREPEYDRTIRDFVDNLLNNASLLEEKFSQPKLVRDASKPSADSIIKVISEIEELKTALMQFANDPSMHERIFAFYNAFEQYGLSAMYAWEKLNYGDHTKFMEEGGSLLPFMMVHHEAPNVIPSLVDLLKTESPFVAFDNKFPFTKELTKILTYVQEHFLT